MMVWDLAHSAGAVPVDLNNANADFAVGEAQTVYFSIIFQHSRQMLGNIVSHLGCNTGEQAPSHCWLCPCLTTL